MKTRPILFSAPMVRAILNGTKTQTRRVAVKTSRPDIVQACDFDADECLLEIENRFSGSRYWKPCKYGRPGDRLWVRETWAYGVHALAAERDEDGPFVYAADGTDQGRLCDRWRPSIHMPLEASRILLEITSVRVEPLQDISDSDIESEGTAQWVIDGGSVRAPRPGFDDQHPDAAGLVCVKPNRVAFCSLWESIYGHCAWDKNPLVWVIEFKRVEGGEA